MPLIPLLLTKLPVPSIRPELVSSPRLIERLKAGLHRKLALIFASVDVGIGSVSNSVETPHRAVRHGTHGPLE